MARRRRKGGFRKAAGRRLRAAGRSYRRSRARRKRSPFRMGLIGKSGIGLAGGVPVGLAAVDALDPWVNPTYAALALSDKLRHSLAGFTNNLTTGFGLGAALPTTFGGIAVPNSMAAAAGGYIKTSAAGISLVAIDGIVGMIYRFMAKGRARGRLLGRQIVSG